VGRRASAAGTRHDTCRPRAIPRRTSGGIITAAQDRMRSPPSITTDSKTDLIAC
jgi:hypothetical protein